MKDETLTSEDFEKLMDYILDGLDQTFFVLTGIISQSTDANTVLRHIEAARKSSNKLFGSNLLRKRLLRVCAESAAGFAGKTLENDHDGKDIRESLATIIHQARSEKKH